METQTSFDLNQAIATWRQELAAQPGLTPADAQELEAHLRESVTSLQQRGLSAAEAFLIARRRVGPSGAIAEEFIKAEPSRYWRLCLVCAVAGAIITNLWQTTLTVWAQVLLTFFEKTYILDFSSNGYGLLLCTLYLLIIIVPLFVLARWLMRRRAAAPFIQLPRWLFVAIGILGIILVERLQLWGIHLLHQNTYESSQAISAAMGADVGVPIAPLKNISDGIFAGMDVGYSAAQSSQFGNNVLWCSCMFVLLICLLPRRQREQTSMAK